MFCWTSPWSEDAKSQKAYHDQIEDEIAKQKLSQDIKLLLLGTAECGKSTILKQIKILHKGGLDENEMTAVKAIIYGNIFDALDNLCKAMLAQDRKFCDPSLQMSANIISGIEDAHRFECPDKSVAQMLGDLWADESVKKTFDEFHQAYHIPANAKIFLDDMARIFSSDFTPTEQDALHTRIATTGIIEVNMVLTGMPIRVFDVGGQRSQRRKWIHCFDNVNAIIFMSAISEFDQVLVEDEQTNRLMESMGLFRTICNSSLFKFNVSLILFLNKIDLFAEKLAKQSVKILFRDYTGTNDFDESVKFVGAQFSKTNEYPDKRKIYTHQTCATSTDQVQLVLGSVFSTIMRNNMKQAGMSV